MAILPALVAAFAAASSTSSLTFQANGGKSCKLEFDGSDLNMKGCKLGSSATGDWRSQIEQKINNIEGTMAHPCKDTTGKFKDCDHTNGICSATNVPGMDTKATKGGVHDLITYHCGCKAGFQWASPSDMTNFACEVTPAPTPSPTNYPTVTPVDCAVSGWSGWSSCSKSCGTGSQTRTRSIVGHPAHGGKPCSSAYHGTHLKDTKSCSLRACACSTMNLWPFQTHVGGYQVHRYNRGGQCCGGYGCNKTGCYCSRAGYLPCEVRYTCQSNLQWSSSSSCGSCTDNPPVPCRGRHCD